MHCEVSVFHSNFVAFFKFLAKVGLPDRIRMRANRQRPKSCVVGQITSKYRHVETLAGKKLINLILCRLASFRTTLCLIWWVIPANYNYHFITFLEMIVDSCTCLLSNPIFRSSASSYASAIIQGQQNAKMLLNEFFQNNAYHNQFQNTVQSNVREVDEAMIGQILFICHSIDFLKFFFF